MCLILTPGEIGLVYSHWYKYTGTTPAPLTSQLPYLLTRSTTGQPFNSYESTKITILIMLILTSMQDPRAHPQWSWVPFPTCSKKQRHPPSSAQQHLRGWCLTSLSGLPQQLVQGRWLRLSRRWWCRDKIAWNCLLKNCLNNLPGNRCTKCRYLVNSPVMQQTINQRYDTYKLDVVYT